ncbi:MAG: molecular chaperone DnaJ, partial [Nitrosopumilales archaeon CG_4_9_14_0_8_um_filter_34_10]
MSKSSIFIILLIVFGATQIANAQNKNLDMDL